MSALWTVVEVTNTAFGRVVMHANAYYLYSIVVPFCFVFSVAAGGHDKGRFVPNPCRSPCVWSAAFFSFAVEKSPADDMLTPRAVRGGGGGGYGRLLRVNPESQRNPLPRVSPPRNPSHVPCFELS